MILVIDNYDSFVHNLARYFVCLGQETCVVRNDAISVAAVRRLRPDAMVISPGPCTPYEAGCSLELIAKCWDELPILGVCLGHQAIAAALGGRVVRANRPMHGRASAVYHDGLGMFAKVPSPFDAGRYHSLIVQEHTLPAELEVTARTASGTIMALQHRQAPVVGLQFHPESILTEYGLDLLRNFLHLAGIEATSDRLATPELLLPMHHEPTPLPRAPVTF